MSAEPDLPALTDGAVELLRIARENDSHRAIARNAALLFALKFVERVVETCRGGGNLGQLFGADAAPPTFLGFVSLSLRAIQSEVDTMYSSNSGSSMPVVTDFNVHVLEGVALAFADAAWPRRSADDFDGPPIAEVVASLAEREPEQLWRLLLQHYVGNVLQDVFAAARIRDEVRDLPPDAELLLRSRDAALFSQYVFDLCVATQEEGPHPAALMMTLRAALDRVTG